MYKNIKNLNISNSKEKNEKYNDFVWSFNLVLKKKARKEPLKKRGGGEREKK